MYVVYVSVSSKELTFKRTSRTSLFKELTFRTPHSFNFLLLSLVTFRVVLKGSLPEVRLMGGEKRKLAGISLKEESKSKHCHSLINFY